MSSIISQTVNFCNISDKYLEYFNVLSIDLPGFGESDEPDFVWSVYEYADFVKRLVDSLKIKKVILIGHSFGGKVSLVYASKYKVVRKCRDCGQKYCQMRLKMQVLFLLEQ